MVRPFVVQLQHLIPDVEREMILEDLCGQGAIRVVHFLKEPGRLLISNTYSAGRVEHGCTDMVGVCVTIDDMRDGLIGHLADRPQNIVSESRWRINDDDSLGTHEKHHLVEPIDNPVESTPKLLHEVACAGNGRALSNGRDRSERRHGRTGSPTVGVLAWATAAGEVRLATSDPTVGMVATDKPTPSADRPRNLRRERRATLLVEGPCSWVCSWEFIGNLLLGQQINWTTCLIMSLSSQTHVLRGRGRPA